VRPSQELSLVNPACFVGSIAAAGQAPALSAGVY